MPSPETLSGALLLGAVGLVLLGFGADQLVRGASWLGARLGISPVLMGLTVVAFGTSAPELAVTVDASLTGRQGLAVGNVVGSNIANVLLILGLSAVVTPLMVSSRLIRLDVPLVVAVSLLVLVFSVDRAIGRLEGLVLLGGGVLYLAVLFRAGRSQRPLGGEGVRDRLPGRWRILLELLRVVGGLILLLASARWLVEGAVALGGWLGVSEVVLGLTVVAAGTSLPELAASVTASLRGARDLAVGNVVGSNIFNLLFVLGAGAVAAPGGLTLPPGALFFDLPVMVGAVLLCLPIFLTGRAISRFEGWVLLGLYVLYVAALYGVGVPTADTTAGAALVFVLALVLLGAGEAARRWSRQREDRIRAKEPIDDGDE